MKLPRIDIHKYGFFLKLIHEGKDYTQILKEYRIKFGAGTKGQISNMIRLSRELGWVEHEKYKETKLTTTGEFYMGIFSKLG